MRARLAALLKKEMARDTAPGRFLRGLARWVGRWRGRAFVAGEFLDYPDWIRATEPDAATLEAERASWDAEGCPERVCVVMPTFNPDPELLEEAVASLIAQTYPDWRLVICDDGSTVEGTDRLLARIEESDPRIRVLRLPENRGISEATNAAVEAGEGGLIAFLDHDDRLAPQALSRIVRTFETHPEARLVFTDEDKLDAAGRRCEPYFKPGFSRALLYARNYINHFSVIRRDAFERVGMCRTGADGAQDFALLLDCLEAFGPQAFRHEAAILYHWRKPDGRESVSGRGDGRAWAAGSAALTRHMARAGERVGRVEPGFGGGRRLHFPAALAADTAAVIPTRDRFDLLERCVTDLRAQAGSRLAEILIVDNASNDTVTLDGLARLAAEDPRIRVVRDDGEFNYSRLVNRGAAETESPNLLFLNNDVLGGEPGWLDEMAGWAAMPWAGAVGARLLYPDGRLQHGGILLGPGGAAGHYGRGALRGDAGPFGHLKLPRGVAAVTAACLLVRRTVHDAVGGFDETRFPVTFSDVDYGLRIREAGYENIWTPHATLTHLEGASRGRESGAGRDAGYREAQASLIERWGHWILHDPCGNPNLDRSSELVRLDPVTLAAAGRR